MSTLSEWLRQPEHGIPAGELADPDNPDNLLWWLNASHEENDS